MSVVTRRRVLATAALLGAPWPLAAQPQAKKLRVAGVYGVPVEQQWVGRIHLALKALAARGEIDYGWHEGVAGADFERVLRQQAEVAPDLIVGESFAVEDAARRVAREHRKQAFLMGSGGRAQAPNFSVFDNYIHEPAYLSGMVAAGMSRSGTIGLVAGQPVPEVNRLMNAFIAGCLEVNPKAVLPVRFMNSWFDPQKARQAAFELIDQGADVLYAERFGVAEAAQERKVLAVGNVSNMQERYPETVIVSALWHVEPTIAAALQRLRIGRFRGEDYGMYSMMRHGGSALSPLGTFEKRVPAELVERVRAREKSIVAGKFRVRVIDQPPRSRP